MGTKTKVILGLAALGLGYAAINALKPEPTLQELEAAYREALPAEQNCATEFDSKHPDCVGAPGVDAKGNPTRCHNLWWADDNKECQEKTWTSQGLEKKIEERKAKLAGR